MAGDPPLLLLAEDDEAERARLAALAEDLGFAVEATADGAQALALAKRRLPAVLVTDLYMPGLCGLDLVEALRATPGGERVPVLVVTSDDLRRTRIRALQSGADDFLCKPVDHLEFTARLGALARRARLIGHLGEALATQDALRARLERELSRPSDAVVALAAAMERGPDPARTRAHLRRVSETAGILARAFGQDRAFVADIRQYSVLHDVGFVALPERPLRPAAPPAGADVEELRTHTLLGGEMLREAGLPAMACAIAAHHHERWDGCGCPHGLAGAAIPLEARIVAVADCLDDLLAGQDGADPRGLEAAWPALRAEGDGGRLDPDLAGTLQAVGRHVERVLATWPPVALQRQGWAG
jgi:putative two-component system response regulator